MSDPRHHPAPEPAEEFDREIHVRGIVWTAAGILAVTAVSMVLMAWLAVDLKHGLERADREPTPAQRAAAARREVAAPAAETATAAPALELPAGSLRPPGPQLQPSPEGELVEMRAEEDALLDGYGWVDRDRGLVRVPIERAMADLVKHGLPRFEPGTGGEGGPAPGALDGEAAPAEPTSPAPSTAPAGAAAGGAP